jgi:uncharacterized protein YyaL (SSP411 family)
MSNRLAQESSPYLRQHADNPVHWYPWGQEALERAKTEDKPIFLSIGYSACHWCHVMEHESFSNDALAAFLNEHFVCIKVDREERPDLDQIYMQAVTSLSRSHGGWPLSAFLTPDLDVFFGGTYWPPQARQGLPGFDHVLKKVLEAYTERRDEVQKTATQLTHFLNQRQDVFRDDETELDDQILLGAAESLVESGDFERGGFGEAPKFPQSMSLRLALKLSSFPNAVGREYAAKLRLLTRQSLDGMGYGGLYDQIGGGFCRYSVDANWTVPHFEKMLYDNALLIHAYLDAWQQESCPRDEQLVKETCEFLLAELQSPEGGFYCTMDADSEGEEGRYYVWKIDEIETHLTPITARRLMRCCNVTQEGNFEGSNVLQWSNQLDKIATEEGVSCQALIEELGKARQTLLAVRSKRIPPSKDDKVLVSWNGLAIDALARAGRVFQEPRYTGAAVQAARFILRCCKNQDGRLIHSYRLGQRGDGAFLDDYSGFVVACLSLYEATFQREWLVEAERLANIMITDFHDDQRGGFFYTPQHHERLITRAKEFQDSSVPSGNSLAAQALLHLGSLLDRSDYVEIAQKTIRAGRSLWSQHPAAASQLLWVLLHCCFGVRQLVLLPGEDPEENKAAVQALQGNSRAGDVIAYASSSEEQQGMLKSLFQDRVPRDGKATLYCCRHFSCDEPWIGLRDIVEHLTSQ